MRAFVKSTLLAGCLVFGSHSVLAQPLKTGDGYPPCTKTPSAQDVTAAKGAFQAGQVYFKEANYTQALSYWEDAYRRDCTAHKLLLNVATAYQLDGQLKNAVTALGTYLARVPNAPDRDQVQRRLDALKAKLDEQVAAAPPVEPGPVRVDDGQAAQPELPPDEATDGRPVAALALTGVGAAMAVGGVVWVIIENGNVADWERICPPDPANPDNRVCPDPNDVPKAEAAQQRRTAAIVVASLGGAAVAGGLIWYFMSEPAPGEESAALPEGAWATVDAVTPKVGDDFVGLGVTGRF